MSNPEVNRPVYFSQMDLYEERRLYVKRLIDGPRFGGSKADFAKEADISPTYVSRMISDPSKPGHKRIADHLARAFLRPPQNNLPSGVDIQCTYG